MQRNYSHSDALVGVLGSTLPLAKPDYLQHIEELQPPLPKKVSNEDKKLSGRQKVKRRKAAQRAARALRRELEEEMARNPLGEP